MKLDEFIKEGKRDYLSVKPPERVTTYGWLELRDKLVKKLSPRDLVLWFLVRPAFATALVILLLVGLTGAVVASAKGSLPGETLYPVKRAYEDVITSVTGNKEIKIEGRAQEIIILSQKEEEDSERLKESVIEYEVTVAKIEEKVNKEERLELKERLKRHKEEFQRIYERTRSKEELRKAIEATEIKEEEIKGAMDEIKDEEEDSRDFFRD